MSYDLKLFRKEVKNEYQDLSFLEQEETVMAFTTEQFEKLKRLLLHYHYQVEDESQNITTYNFKGGELGITAYLTNNCLTFQCAGGNQEGLFEIMQTSDELSDRDFLTLDLQEGTWSGMYLDEEPEIEHKNEAPSKNTEANGNATSNNPKPWWKFW